MAAEAVPRVIVAQLGGRMHYAVPRILHWAGMLERLYTDTYIGNKPWLEQALRTIPEHLQPRPLSRLLGRKNGCFPPGRVTSFDLFGVRYVAAVRRAGDTATLALTFAAWNRRFCEKVIVSRPPDADVVWGFNGAALELFRWAKTRGMCCVLEQTIAPRRVERRLLLEELEHWPDWQPSLQLPADPDPLAEREEAEWQLADRIIAGSRFVMDGLETCGGPVERCTVIPYGVDTARFTRAAKQGGSNARRLRVLFAGEVGLRKGVPYLMEALRELGPKKVEAKFAGQVVLARNKLTRYDNVVAFLGHVPGLEMPELYRWADVFVLPSVCEGSAAVIYEALAAGLYVITTPNAGSVLSGSSPAGRVVPIRSAEAIAAALEAYSPATGSAGARAGAITASISLQAYGANVLTALASING